MTPAQTRTAPPTRSTTQRLEALERANRIRLARSALKRRIKADPTYRLLGLAIGNDVEAIGLEVGELDTMKVAELILAAPKLGRVRVNNALNALGVSPSKTVAGLTERQRDELLAELRRPGTARHLHPNRLGS